MRCVFSGMYRPLVRVGIKPCKLVGSDGKGHCAGLAGGESYFPESFEFLRRTREWLPGSIDGRTVAQIKLNGLRAGHIAGIGDRHSNGDWRCIG